MPLQYIIDGYNIINHPIFIQRINKKTEDLRIALLKFIKIERSCGSRKNKVTVVFDGYFDLSGFKNDLGDINIIFSRRQTADEKIKSIVEESSRRKDIIVVSDDKEIKFFVKSQGAQWIGTEEFIGCKEKLKNINKDLLKPELNFSQINKINQELKKIWLK